MSTVDKKFADRIIANNGFYSESNKAEYEVAGYRGGDNSRCVRLVEYTNAWGNKAYGATFEHETPERQKRYLQANEYIRDPLVIWSYEEPRENAKAVDAKQVTPEQTGVRSLPVKEHMAQTVEVGKMLRVMVNQDGVFLDFGNAIVHVDSIGPQSPMSIIRRNLNKWCEEVKKLAAK
jgi:hypothetical protein